MTAHNYLYLVALLLGIVGCCGRACAEGDVTIVSEPASTSTTTAQKTAQANDPAVIHKSLHKKKPTSTAKTTPPATTTPAKTVATGTTGKTETTPQTPHPTVAQTTKTSTVASPAAGPTVETGLPVAKRAGSENLVPGAASSIAPGWQNATHPYDATMSTSISSTTVDRFSDPTTSFPFTDFTRKAKNTYPWKAGIFTTKFWIGEGSSAISSTDNVASSWDENWRSSNRGADDPDNRSGYAPADHAPTLNTFYVALPFNDLADPDKARRWLPPGWYRRPKDGKQVSACKDRWVEIKNSQGRICYAQWEDVGPLDTDHAEYVFGPERPDRLGNDHAGLDVSPAVAQYLGLGESGYTSWRFVDDDDVQTGPWLKYEELALLYQAMHQEKSLNLPIQSQSEPIDDASTISTNKKKVGAAKG